jgi:hypothetical protein
VHRIIFALVFVLMMVTAGWYAFQFKQDDPAGRAMLESWAAGVSAATSSEVAGYSCELSAVVEGGQDWVLTLSVETRSSVFPIPEKEPMRFLVEVNDHSSSVGAGPDGDFVIRVPLHAFRLNQRANDVTMLVVSQDGTDFGGWAFGNITFEEGGVGLAEPSWFDELLD